MIKCVRPRIAPLDTRRVKPPPTRGDPSPYSSDKWVRFRKELIAERGRRCEDPRHDPTRSFSGQIYADHIVELRDGGAMFDKTNVMLRCPACHTKKTLRERGKRAAERY